MEWPVIKFVSLLCLLTIVPNWSAGVTMMSIDVGSEWIKVAVVAPGVPMEIALNKESKRKTASAVAYRDVTERLFGDDALSAGIKIPSNNFRYFLDLLGKKIDNPVVEIYKQRFPYYKIEADPDRDTIMFRYDENTVYSVEELMAQLLSQARHMAMAHTDQRIKDAVITVPPFFNQAERRALLAAANLAGLKVLTLMNSNAAVALNYGMFRRKEINETVQNILFYDMGASSTTATIAAYQTVKTKEKGYTETNPQVTILGVGYDRTLGGMEMQIRLRDYLAKNFNKVKKTDKNVFDSPRALAKLMKEAGRLKNVLSANSDHYSQVEGVLDDEDFRLKVTREEYEELFTDLLDRVRGPVDQALVSAAMDITNIDQFIIVGGGTRTPKVQNILQNIWGGELGKNINADEAAAMGAVYRAADLGQGFKVKKFHVKDIVIFPIEVDFERQIETDDGKPTTKIVKRSLFAVGNNYPQKKVMTFNKHTADFGFSVNYGDLSHLPKLEKKIAAADNVSFILVKSVTDVFVKNLKDGGESKGIKAHFTMDDSGIITLSNIEAVFEKNITVEVEKEESTLSKIGSTLSKLFSGSEDGKSDLKLNATEEETTPDDKDKKKEEKVEPKKADKEKATGNEKEGKDQKEVKETKAKLVTMKEDLNFTKTFLDISELNEEKYEKSAKKLASINKVEKARQDKEAGRNALESYILDAQDKLWQKEFKVASTEDVRVAIRAMCSKLDEWIYDEGFDEEAAVYKEKLTALEKLFEPIRRRVHEQRERPEALKALHDMINMSSSFFHTAKTTSEAEEWFTDVELSTMDNLIINTQKWLEEKEEEHDKTPLYEDSKLTLYSIGEKINALDREIKYLVNKAKMARAKKEREALEAKLKADKEAKEAAKANQTEKETESKATNDKSTKEEATGEDFRQEPPLPLEDEEVLSEENDSEANKRKSYDEYDTIEPDSPEEEESHTEL